VGASGKGIIVEMFANIKNPTDWSQYDSLGPYQFPSENLDGAILVEIHTECE